MVLQVSRNVLNPQINNHSRNNLALKNNSGAFIHFLWRQILMLQAKNYSKLYTLFFSNDNNNNNIIYIYIYIYIWRNEIFGCQGPPNMLIHLRSIMNNDPFVLHGKKCDIINTWLCIVTILKPCSQSKLLKYYPENIDFVLSSFISTHFHRCMNQKRIIFNSITCICV